MVCVSDGCPGCGDVRATLETPDLSLGMVYLVEGWVAACGGDDAGGGEALTKAEWIAAADAICVGVDEELGLIPEPQTPEEMGEAGVRVWEIHRAGLAELRALTPPEGDEAAVEGILDAAEAWLDWCE